MKNRSLVVLFSAVLLFLLQIVPLAYSKTPPSIGQSPNTFRNIVTGLPNLHWSSTTWGDYDNDGSLDILLTGSFESGNPFSGIFHNNGNGTFTNINAGLPGLAAENSVTWGDYNNDGYLDVLSAGLVSKICRNNGDGSFTDINADLPVLGGSTASVWGDLDNDGRLDLLMTGQEVPGGEPMTKLLHNDGNGAFTEMLDTGLPNVGSGRVALGDQNNDGLLDVAMSGYPGGPSYICRIYRNNGDGTFTDIDAGLPGFAMGCIAWGDYDNDGYSDLFLSGVSSPWITGIYRNNGDGSFTDINAGLAQVFGPGRWGDYDSDGYLDLLVTGDWERTRIYHNNRNGTFTDINVGLTGVNEGDAVWGDYDNNGRLDVLLSGWTGATGAATRLYQNKGGFTNTAPAAPTGLSAVFYGDDLTLSWEKATDAQTPQDGLTYNIYMGTAPGAVNVLSPMAAVPGGFRRIAAMGAQGENTSWTIKDLPPGNYYWSVQAIDTGLKGSAFAAGGAVDAQ